MIALAVLAPQHTRSSGFGGNAPLFSLSGYTPSAPHGRSTPCAPRPVRRQSERRPANRDLLAIGNANDNPALDHEQPLSGVLIAVRADRLPGLEQDLHVRPHRPRRVAPPGGRHWAKAQAAE